MLEKTRRQQLFTHIEDVAGNISEAEEFSLYCHSNDFIRMVLAGVKLSQGAGRLC